MAFPGATRAAVSSVAQELTVVGGRQRGWRHFPMLSTFVHQALNICCGWGQKGALQSGNLTTTVSKPGAPNAASNWVVAAGFQSETDAPRPQWHAPSCKKGQSEGLQATHLSSAQPSIPQLPPHRLPVPIPCPEP